LSYDPSGEDTRFNEQPSKWDGKPAKAQLPMLF